MKYLKLPLILLAMVAIVSISAIPAQAESIKLVLNGVTQGTFGCSGLNGCFGNDITLSVSGATTNWTVNYAINTTGNTNAGAGIASVSFILTGFSYVDAQIALTAAPGGSAGWSEDAGPTNASGSGCNGSTSNSVCTFDTSAINSGTGLNASPLGGATYTWTWAISGQTFGGFDSATHVQALFGNLNADCSPKCFNGTGLISAVPTTTVPEPLSVTLLGLGLGAAALTRRLTR